MYDKIIKLRSWLLIGYIGTLTGCAHIYYAPNAHNVPFFKEKGEGIINAAVGAGTDEVDLSVDIQTAYAVTKRIGFMANYYRAIGKGENGAGKIEGGYGHLLEFGAGYITPLKNKDYAFEIYGGAGRGRVHNYYDEQKTINTTLQYNRYFLQPAVGWHNEFVDIILSNRFGLLRYYKMHEHQFNQPEYPDQVDGVMKNKNYYLIEPALTMQLGNRAVRGQIQLGYSLHHSAPEFDQEELNANMGLSFILRQRVKK